jgi:hypothetical protein
MISTTEYVNNLNNQLVGLVANPDMTHFAEYEEACRSHVVDPDVVDYINRSPEAESALARMQVAIDAKNTDGANLFRCNGNGVLANESGIMAVHAATIHIEDCVAPDPVAEQHGDYQDMGFLKIGRAVILRANSNYKPTSLGQAFSRRTQEVAGVTGGLFMYGRDDHTDVRAKLLADQAVQADIVKREVLPIDQLAGFADQIRAEIALEGPTKIRLDAMKSRMGILIGKSVNIH